MKVIRATNVNHAWDMAKSLLNAMHIERDSRVGRVWEHPEPVTTVYAKPLERVLFNPARNPNPYFHIMESLWMLAGRNDTAFLRRFNSKIEDFVGKGEVVHGAYGHRWRYMFELESGVRQGVTDQFPKIVRVLKHNANERRAVLQMWKPETDLDKPDLSDVPCNLCCTFKIREGRLCMIVFCRSNDIAYGCYGANAVHFSYLLEYMASMIGVPVGTYTQVSDSWHAYTERWKQVGGLDLAPSEDWYSIDNHLPEWSEGKRIQPYPLVSNPGTFDEDLTAWMSREHETGEFPFDNPFFEDVAEPLWQSWDYFKNGDMEDAMHYAVKCEASDWSLACTNWLQNVQDRRTTRVVIEEAAKETSNAE